MHNYNIDIISENSKEIIIMIDNKLYSFTPTQYNRCISKAEDAEILYREQTSNYPYQRDPAEEAAAQSVYVNTLATELLRLVP